MTDFPVDDERQSQLMRAASALHEAGSDKGYDPESVVRQAFEGLTVLAAHTDPASGYKRVVCAG